MAPKRRVAAAAAQRLAENSDEPAPKRTRKAPAAVQAKKAAPAPPAAAADDDAPMQPSGRSFYLMKSEPDEFSIDDLAARPNQTEPWDGVRSHQAKNVMQGMRVGDQAFFYHSNAKPPGIVGIIEVVREAYPDPSQYDESSERYDAASKADSPRWFMVDVRLVRKLSRQIGLAELKRRAAAVASPLADMALIKFSRLSVQPVTAEQWQHVLELENAEEEGSG